MEQIQGLRLSMCSGWWRDQSNEEGAVDGTDDGAGQEQDSYQQEGGDE